MDSGLSAGKLLVFVFRQQILLAFLFSERIVRFRREVVRDFLREK